TVFGKVINGMDVVRKIGSSQTNNRDQPIEEILIADCGALQVDKPFSVEKESAN
ncbi:MAG: peptidylprolyl isomerase, partial [Microcystis panniformis]